MVRYVTYIQVTPNFWSMCLNIFNEFLMLCVYRRPPCVDFISLRSFIRFRKAIVKGHHQLHVFRSVRPSVRQHRKALFMLRVSSENLNQKILLTFAFVLYRLEITQFTLRITYVYDSLFIKFDLFNGYTGYHFFTEVTHIPWLLRLLHLPQFPWLPVLPVTSVGYVQANM